LSGLVVIAGAGGFIGGQLRRRLEAQGIAVRGVDYKPPAEWFYRSARADELVGDLKDKDFALAATKGADGVYNFAADMGGMGFIENNKTACMLSVLINTNLLLAAVEHRVGRFFFASSACVYPDYRQNDAEVAPLKESDAYPAMPEDGYGWEKLFGERMCRHFREDFGLETRVARYHNVYGSYGTWDGGREKAPAAIARKVAMAVISGRHEIEIWGDGGQTRSFTYIEDCLVGTQKLMESSVAEPLNIGSDELVTINELVDIVEEIAEVRLKRRYKLDAPKGVRGRNSDNTLIRQRLGWAPSTPLKDGMAATYRWVYDEVKARAEGRPVIGATA
jgi:GDP-D-mannose 3',5'-epimerase